MARISRVRLSPRTFFWTLLAATALLVLGQGVALEILLRRFGASLNRERQRDTIFAVPPRQVRILAAGGSQISNGLDLEREDFLNIAYPSERIGDTFIKLSYHFARGMRPSVVILPWSHHTFCRERDGVTRPSDDPMLLAASARRLVRRLDSYRATDYLDEYVRALEGGRFPESPPDVPWGREPKGFWSHLHLLQFDPMYRGIAPELLGLYLLGRLEPGIVVTPRGALLHPVTWCEELRQRLEHQAARRIDPASLGRKQKLPPPPHKYTEVLPHLAPLYEETIDLCLEQGAWVILLRCPALDALIEHASPRYAEEVARSFGEIIARHRGLERLLHWDCLDLYADPEDEVLFHDDQHLNAEGARLLSAWVGKRLVEEGLAGS